MTTKTGRKPTTGPAVHAAIQSSPADGLDYERIAEISGLCRASVKDALWKMRTTGAAHWLKRGGVLLYFGSAELRDFYDAANPAGKVRVRRRGRSSNGRPPRAPRIIAAISHTGATATEIERTTGIGANHIRRILGQLESAGEVVRRGTKLRLTWFIADVAPPHDVAAVVEQRPKRVSIEKRTTRRACGESMAARKSRERPAPERKPVEIIGMDRAKFTPSVPKPDHRYVVDPAHRGEFSGMGIGRYLE